VLELYIEVAGETPEVVTLRLHGLVRLRRDEAPARSQWRGLIRRLHRLGYHVLRQNGSHVTLIVEQGAGHRCFVALHKAIKPGTLLDTLRDIAQHHELTAPELSAALEL
jgi:predicted RNA binding protein YcfA (HicA-like mRNA interferase family)